jgi:hypothetical protein
MQKTGVYQQQRQPRRHSVPDGTHSAHRHLLSKSTTSTSTSAISAATASTNPIKSYKGGNVTVEKHDEAPHVELVRFSHPLAGQDAQRPTTQASQAKPSKPSQAQENSIEPTTFSIGDYKNRKTLRLPHRARRTARTGRPRHHRNIPHTHVPRHTQTEHHHQRPHCDRWVFRRREASERR